MRRIIRGTAYDTTAAELVASNTHGSDAPSGAWWSLYRTGQGAWFEVAAGHDGVVETFTALSDRQAQAWLETNANHLVEQYFGQMPELPPVTEPMSIEKRRLLLAATSLLKALGHSGFDRMLLELGVPDDVGHGSGLLARTTSLGRYLLSNPDARAYDGSSLVDAVIRRAQAVYERGTISNLGDEDRPEFEDAMQANSGPSTPRGTSQPRPSRPWIANPAATAERQTNGPNIPEVRPKARRKVFIVHGHDEGPREAVARFLERLDFEPVILHERPNRGRTIITKFQEEASDVGFAVVLMTPDDPGSSGDLRRARQNVVFELGFFVGALGPERVAAIVKGSVERPSDFDGVMYVDFDNGGGWKLLLARELEAAGFAVDMNAARS